MLDAADDYLSDCELAALKDVDSDGQLAAFFRSWTLKEAYLKARGEGLSIPLHNFSVLLDGMQVKRLDAEDADRWELRILAQDDDFTAAIAFAGKINKINAFRCIPKVEYKELASLQDILPSAARRA